MKSIDKFIQDYSDVLSRLNIPDILLPFRLRIIWLDFVNKASLGRIYTGEHFHSFYEFHFVMSGNVTYILNGCELTVLGGEFVVIPPKVSHSHFSCSDDAIKLSVAFETDDEKLLGILESVDISRKGIADVYNVSKRIMEYVSALNVFTPSLAGGAINEIIYDALKALGVCFEPFGGKQCDLRVKAATEYINKNISSMINSEDVAKECCLSVKQLGRVFKSEMGISVSEYIKRVRLNSAKSLLITTDLSIKEIAYSVGFESQSSFMAFFKHRMGVSPGIFRNADNMNKL